MHLQRVDQSKNKDEIYMYFLDFLKKKDAER